MSIGRGQRQALPLDLDQHAGQHRSRLIRGRSHLRLLDRPDQLIERNLQAIALVRARPWWKLLGLNAFDVRVETRAAQTKRLSRGVESHLQLVVRQSPDEVGE